MQRYDEGYGWGWSRAYGAEEGGRGYGGAWKGTDPWGEEGYGFRFARPAEGAGRRPWSAERASYDRDLYSAGRGGRGLYGRPRGRGVYGEGYPGFGGYPGGGRGTYQRWDEGYGRGWDPNTRAARWDQGRLVEEPAGRWWRGGTGETGGGGYAREPFVPEEAYARHPELGYFPHRPDDTLRGGADRAAFDDGEVFHAVRAALHHDRFLAADAIHVMVNDGVVTLEGEVNDYLEARYAWDDAWETEGVRGVVNNLTVRVDQPHDAHGDVMPQTGGD